MNLSKLCSIHMPWLPLDKNLNFPALFAVVFLALVGFCTNTTVFVITIFVCLIIINFCTFSIVGWWFQFSISYLPISCLFLFQRRRKIQKRFVHGIKYWTCASCNKQVVWITIFTFDYTTNETISMISNFTIYKPDLHIPGIPVERRYIYSIFCIRKMMIIICQLKKGITTWLCLFGIILWDSIVHLSEP